MNKVVIICSGLQIGGAEIMLLRLLPFLSAEMKILIISLKPGIIADRIRKYQSLSNRKIEVIECKNALCYLRAFYRTLSFKPECIYGWMYHGNLIAALLGTLSFRPFIFNIRQSLGDLHLQKAMTRFVIIICKWLSYKANKVIYNSYSGMQSHIKYGYNPNNANVVQNAIDTNIFKMNKQSRRSICNNLGLKENVVLVGMIARFHPVKNHMLFFQAANIISRSIPNARFILAGTEMLDTNKMLQEMIMQNNLEGKVFLLGLRSDLAELTSALDIAINCSISEGFANNVLEAAACGVPVVATDVGDAKYITDEVLDPNCTSKQLADKCIDILNYDKAEQSKRKTLLRDKITSKYDIKVVAQQYIDVMKQIAKSS